MAIVIAALIAAVPPSGIVYLTWRKNNKKLDEIHVLVNSRLTEALSEISSLKDRLDQKDMVIAEQAKDK